MAVLALGFVGEAIGASIGGTLLGVSAASIGGFVGSLIGQTIDNMLFPVKQQGPRLSDLTVQTSTYGNPIPVIFGPENRAAGNVIWSSGLIETVHHQKSGGLGGKGGPTVDSTTYTYSAHFGVALCDCSRRGPINRIVKIWANKKLVYDASTASGPVSDPVGADGAGLWSSMRFYPGDFTQMPDPIYEAAVGIGEAPAHRGTANVFFESFQLADYGNRLPSLEFLIEADSTITAGEVLSFIVEVSGIDPNTVSTSTIDGNLRGHVIGQSSSGTGAIQPMALVFNFDSAQVGGTLRFCGRGVPPFATVPLLDLSGHAPADDRPAALQWTHALETSLPREAAISYSDPALDYQVSSQSARRQSGSANSNLTAQIPIVVDADTARQLADRMLWEAWTGRSSANSQTDDSWLSLEPGRCYAMITPAGYEPLRLKTKTRGVNGVIELELARDRSQVYRSIAGGISGNIPQQQVNVPEPSFMALIDCPILQDADDDTGFYFVLDGVSAGWRGADVKRSTDAGVSYDEVEPVGIQSCIGVVDFLGDGATEVFDNVNLVTVTLNDPSDELSSVSELEVLNGANACWIGGDSGEDGEVLQFKTATLVSPGVYQLSGLLRGRLGTEYAVGLHGSGETFILLQQGGVQRADFSPSDWNKARLYKAVSLLTLEADATAIPFTNTGEGKRPLSPVHVEGSVDPVSGDVTISWVRRSRLRQPGMGNGSVPLGESVESYEVDIYRGATFERTLSSTSPTTTYTAAQKAADGFSPGDTATLAVYQISDVRGRGRPANARILV